MKIHQLFVGEVPLLLKMSFGLRLASAQNPWPPHAAISLQSVGLHGVNVTELTKLVSRVKSLAAKVCRAFFLLLRLTR